MNHVKTRFAVSSLITIMTSIGCSNAQGPVPVVRDVEIAKTYYDHGLAGEAKSMLLAIATDKKQPDSSKADALYWLGQIAFEENRYRTALSDWQDLTELYPSSPRSVEMSARLDQLRDLIGQSASDVISSLTAQAYIKHGDFWSKADDVFTIDASWLPKVELAVGWYDRVINEFPKSDDAEAAYRRKLNTILGWRGVGQYEDSQGIAGNPKKYMPQLLTSFQAFQADFPESAYLQGFRYQIGQAYWGARDWANARLWFQTVIDSSDGEETFYSETAKARLQKIEY